MASRSFVRTVLAFDTVLALTASASAIWLDVMISYRLSIR